MKKSNIENKGLMPLAVVSHDVITSAYTSALAESAIGFLKYPMSFPRMRESMENPMLFMNGFPYSRE